MNLFENQSQEKSQQKVYSVSDLNREIRACIEPRFTMIWVEAEISNLKLHTSGHIYLTLKDEKSQLSAVFFSRYNQGLKFRLKDGLKVLAFGKISEHTECRENKIALVCVAGIISNVADTGGAAF